MDPKDTKLILIGVLVVLIIVALFYVVSNLSGITQSSSFVSKLTLNKSMGLSQFGSILSSSSSSQINVSYSGVIKIKQATGGVTTSTAVNVSEGFADYNNTSVIQFSYIVPSTYSYQITNYSYTILRNGSNTFYCGYELSSTYTYLTNYSCINQTSFGVISNTSRNYTLGAYTLLAAKNLNIKVSHVSQSTYNKNQCTLLNGTIGGNVPSNSFEDFSTGVYAYAEPGVNTATVSGSFSTCISNKYLTPLVINATVKVSGLSQTLNFQIAMNMTSVKNMTSYNDTTTPPGQILNLSQILVGYCYSSVSEDYLQGQNLDGYCINPYLNSSGTMKLHYESYISGVKFLGLACTLYPQYSYYTTSIYPPVTPQAPTPSQFTAVNITAPLYANATLYFNCPINDTKLGGYNIDNLWAYYSIDNSAPTVSEFQTSYAYVTTSSPLGKNVNTGTVKPLPSSFPTSTSHGIPYINITSVGTGTNNSYQIGGSLSYYADVSPDASVQVELISSTNSSHTITFTPDSYADAYGYIESTFFTESNISPGPWTLRITDLSTGESAEANFTMSGSTYTGFTTTLPP